LCLIYLLRRWIGRCCFKRLQAPLDRHSETRWRAFWAVAVMRPPDRLPGVSLGANRRVRECQANVRLASALRKVTALLRVTWSLGLPRTTPRTLSLRSIVDSIRAALDWTKRATRGNACLAAKDRQLKRPPSKDRTLLFRPAEDSVASNQTAAWEQQRSPFRRTTGLLSILVSVLVFLPSFV
jgi:hypothetical protein